MTQVDNAEIEREAGFSSKFIRNLMDLVQVKRVPLAAIHRLTTDGGRKTLGKMVDIAYADWQDEQRKYAERCPQGSDPYRKAATNGNTLPSNHYHAPVAYAPLPSMDELKKEWGKNNVSDIFNGQSFSFHASCVGMDRTPGGRLFYLHDAGNNWGAEKEIAWGASQCNAAAPNGYRPATHEETYEFAKAHPELAGFVGLGSFVLDGDKLRVVHVWRRGKRFLGDHWFTGKWGRRTSILFVCKQRLNPRSCVA